MVRKQVLILASVATMIEKFNMPNIKLLIDLGYKVHVACNFEVGNTCLDEQLKALKNKLTALDVPFHQIDFKRNAGKMFDNIKAYNQVYDLMKDNQYEFVHCHSPIGGVCGRLAGRATNTKVIYTAHGFHFYKGSPLKNWLAFYPVEKLLSRFTDVLITINKEDYQRAKRRLKAKSIAYVPGVGIDLMNGIIVDNKLKRQEMRIPENAFLVTSAGELNKNKNHEVIIRALSLIGNPHIHYLICGHGILEGYLIKLAEELGLGENVHLVGFRKDIYELYFITDLFVQPSFREGLSVSLMEAMAAGLPVICSNIRGNKDLIIDDYNGYLVGSNVPKSYADKIVTLYNDNIKRTLMGKRNKEVIKKFSIESVSNIINTIYKGIETQ